MRRSPRLASPRSDEDFVASRTPRVFQSLGAQNTKWRHRQDQHGGDIWYCMQTGHVTWTVHQSTMGDDEENYLWTIGEMVRMFVTTKMPLYADPAKHICRFLHYVILLVVLLGMGDFQGKVYLRVRRVKKRSYFHKGHEKNSIHSWLASASASTKEQFEIISPAKESASRESDKQHIDESMGWLSTYFMGPSVQIGTNPSNSKVPLNHDLALPALGDLDLGVVASLPPDLFSEINDIYDGKLINLISKKKGKSVAQERVQVPPKEGSGTFYHHPACVNENRVVDKEEKYPLEKIQPGPSNMGISTEVSNKLDVMPSSLSQVDTSVLQQLPEELRVDILQLLPAHRQPECIRGSTGRLSSILQCTLSESQPLVDASNDGWDDAIRCLCDLLKQYIKLRVETDIEEIYVSFVFLKGNSA
ncbi:hypothetical protein RHGRI_013931 [Rhododendron griersonianum]|uniref:Uncharacterized protein n=1 Tax=Rhododendron griersonianum TaxID=479676 RepID=A0AAV6K7S5_9ERIC|nr:hypothetical protein RHGRI_013931 [Rhododendron griersonianum]